MGKPSAAPSPFQNDDAFSLHTQPGGRFLDDDAPELQVDDLPPLYDDAISEPLEAGGSGSASGSNAPLLPAVAPGERDPDSEYLWSPYHLDSSTGTKYYVDKRFDDDPKLLEDAFLKWAADPPRFSVRVEGTHSQTVDKAGKKERQRVTDFDVLVELTPYLYSDPVRHLSWRELYTVEELEKARRGTVLRKRAPGVKQSIEVGRTKPTLGEWCHRYCASHAGLKCMTLQRRVHGFDTARVKEKLMALVRNTNYRGHVSITFPLKDARVDVYNDCRTNRWRLSNWVKWLCYLTLMFIFTWPYLFFRTKRFEVVFSDWYYSTLYDDGTRRYVSISEDQWYNMWGRAINRAVLEKRQCTLDQQDLVRADVPDPVYGHRVVDGAMNFVRAGIGAMNEVNRTLGWGYDS